MWLNTRLQSRFNQGNRARGRVWWSQELDGSKLCSRDMICRCSHLVYLCMQKWSEMAILHLLLFFQYDAGGHFQPKGYSVYIHIWWFYDTYIIIYLHGMMECICKHNASTFQRTYSHMLYCPCRLQKEYNSPFSIHTYIHVLSLQTTKKNTIFSTYIHTCTISDFDFVVLYVFTVLCIYWVEV